MKYLFYPGRAISGGAIAGIFIAVIFVAIVIGGIAWYAYRRYAVSSPSSESGGTGSRTSFENPMQLNKMEED